MILEYDKKNMEMLQAKETLDRELLDAKYNFFLTFGLFFLCIVSYINLQGNCRFAEGRHEVG